MAMKNVKNIYNPAYAQIDNKTPEICQISGVEILPSRIAWEKYNWTKKYFQKKPKQGYFIWAKKNISSYLSTCISIAAKNTKQNLQNLLVIEKNLKVNLQGTCASQRKNLSGEHQAKGKIILKENSVLKYEHIQSWDKSDIVESDYQFILEKKSKLDYFYKNFQSPKKLKINTQINAFEKASANLNIIINSIQSDININDILILKEKNSSGIIKLRLVGKENSKITARSQIRAEAESKGHLDCQGLLTDSEKNNSIIKLIPELVCQNKKAQITHEASIGKISEEELNYLRMRGLTEKQAIDLIVNGFLEA
jgi:Fe-S cluster assembly scaffold protein SufB